MGERTIRHIPDFAHAIVVERFGTPSAQRLLQSPSKSKCNGGVAAAFRVIFINLYHCELRTYLDEDEEIMVANEEEKTYDCVD